MNSVVDLINSEHNGGVIRRALIAFCVALAVFSAPASPPALVDLNRASVAELMQVRGMTATWAARIVRFRPYRTKQDLVLLGVMPPEVYQRIRDGVIAHQVQAVAGHR